MADRKLACDSINQVEADGKNDIDADENNDLIVVGSDQTAQSGLQDDKQQDRRQPEGPLPHTFSVIPLPMMPVGLSSRIKTRMMKAIASRYVDSPYPTAMTSAMPRIKPPSIAPVMLPIPPRTAATKAFRPGMTPIKGSILGYSNETRMPPAPARADPRANVKAMILSVLIPISFAASKLKETARMAFPVLV